MDRILICILWTTYSALCISTDRLTIDSASIELSLVPEESLRDGGLMTWDVYDSLSKSRSLASRAAIFSRSNWVRLFFKLSSYRHSWILFI